MLMFSTAGTSSFRMNTFRVESNCYSYSVYIELHGPYRIRRYACIVHVAQLDCTFAQNRSMANLTAVVLVLLVVACSGSLIQGPWPMSVVAPIGSTVEFECVVNTTELISGVFVNILWKLNNQSLPANDNQNLTICGDIGKGTLRLDVAENYTPGVSVQCGFISRNPLSQTLSDTNASLAAYGKNNVYIL